MISSSVDLTKGSLWRIWDLHVHTPASFGGDYNDFIEKAGQCKAAVIGINDYCSIAGYEEIINRGSIPGKTLFPVVEFRMHNLLHTKKNPKGVRINFHVIFDNDPSVFSKIKTWIASVDCFDDKGKNSQLGALDSLLIKQTSFDFDGVIESLKKFDLYDTHSLIWLPYDEYGGIDEINPVSNGFFKLAMIDKAHIIGTSTEKQIEFFKFQDSKFTIDQYNAWFDKPKPCIKGSDAHKNDYPFGCLQDAQSQPIEKYCWINSDPTFEGLKQIINEPDRVYIGEEPPLLKRVKSNKTKFIHSLSIKLTPGHSLDDIWFKDFSIKFNSGLVAIIGNKGGGKSAITDIIGLCGNTHQDPTTFSFLTNLKFRKPKPINLSEKFEACLTWEDGTETKRCLNTNPDKSFPERIKYIPQHFLERLCSNVESDLFEKELKQIIYSHTPGDKRLGKASLDELINYKSSLINNDISQIHNELSAINIKIVELEIKSTENHRKAIENQINLRQGELFAHESSKPIPPAIEEGETDDQKARFDELKAIRDQIQAIEKEIAILESEKRDLSIQKEELNRAIIFYQSIGLQLDKYFSPNDEFLTILLKNNIDVSNILQYKIDTSPIESIIERLNIREIAINSFLNTSEGSLTSKLFILNERLKKEQEELDKPAKEKQKYLDELKEWERRKQEIEGSTDTEGTLNFLNNYISYLKESLSFELEEKYVVRKKLAIQLHDKKTDLLAVRKELFQPVMQYIDNFKELKQRYDVKIDVGLEIRGFSEGFFSFIGQNKIGTYNGKEEGYKKLFDLLEKSQFESSENFIQFTEEILSSLRHDKRTPENKPTSIENQLRQGAELARLYDFLFGAGYLQPIYNLKLGNKTLEQLSPGERGALLLIFYLILDNDDIPLIIDQPEENLDNESVYYILVHFIKKAKETRQIIIVTHNPNLAVVCDADQIIHMHIDKENKNKIQVVSGAIENAEINRSIINILEGTLPAFNNRDSKYLKKNIKVGKIGGSKIVNETFG
ncbi:MAG: transporter [Flaviaesturariibacter sp.]|nr:transporter [Flaviaesturariibacter sp.]